jgi:hypothetical protein
MNPSEIPNLHSWWSSSDLSGTYTENDSVGSWTEGSNQSNLTFSQSSITKRPFFKEDVQNGYPAIQFRASDEARLITSSNVDLTSEHSVIFIHRLTRPTRQRMMRIGSLSQSSSEIDFYAEHDEDCSEMIVQSNSPGSQRSYAVSEELSSFEEDVHLWGYTAPNENESDLNFYRDGDLLKTVTHRGANDILPNNADILTVGGTRKSTDSNDIQITGNLNADLFDILLYDRALSEAEIDRLWSFFAQRYAIEKDREPKEAKSLYAWFDQTGVHTDSDSDVEKWESRPEVSGREIIQNIEDNKPGQINTERAEAIKFDGEENTYLESKDRDFNLDDAPYSAVFFFRSDSDYDQKFAELSHVEKDIDFMTREKEAGYSFRMREGNSLFAESAFVPSLDKWFGMISFVVHEPDHVRFFDNDEEFEYGAKDDTNRSLFLENVSRLKVGGEELNAELTEILLYDSFVTSDDIQSIWSYFRKQYLSEFGESSLKGQSSLSADSLTYTFTGNTSMNTSATVSDQGSSATITSSASLSSKANSNTDESFEFHESTDMEALAIPFIQCHKNTKWGRGSITSIASTSIIPSLNIEGRFSDQGEAQITNTELVQIHGGETHLQARSYVNKATYEMLSSLSSESNLTADFEIWKQTQSALSSVSNISILSGIDKGSISGLMAVSNTTLSGTVYSYIYSKTSFSVIANSSIDPGIIYTFSSSQTSTASITAVAEVG